jgi:RNA polymerase sigma-70 factor (ECF subfamily)
MNFILSDTLLEKIRHKNEDAFRVLMKQTRGFAWEVVYRLVRNREDALDIMQEAYIKVWKGIDGYNGKSSFQNWFRRILRNQAIDWWRKHGKIRTEDLQGFDSSLSGHPIDRPDSAFEKSEVEYLIRRGLSFLPETQRLVFMLRDLEGLSIEEVKEETGLTEASIKSNLYLARKRMAEEMEKGGYGMTRRKIKGER